MKVHIKLFGAFRSFLPLGAAGPMCTVDVEDGALLRDVLRVLSVPEEEPKTLVHNRRAGTLNQPLQEGDVVAVFPPVSGGG